MATVKTQLVIDGKNNTRRAFDEVDGSLGKLSGKAKAAGGALLAAFSVGAIAGFVKENALAIADMNRMAQLSGATAEQFQGWAYAARSVGIEQDKLGDIFKDVQDKVGDFLQTGGGELADFFEKVAPAAGVTAEQFRNLSGPDALQLYVKTLDEANLSHSEMVFYLEAIANDATLLLPLLRNNAAGYQALREEAESLGLILSSDTARGADDFNRSLNALGAVADGTGKRITAEALPALNTMTGLLVDVAKEGEYTSRVAEVLAFFMNALASAAIIAGNALGSVGRFIGATAAAIAAAAAGDFKVAIDIMKTVGEDNARETGAAMQRIKNLWNGEYARIGADAGRVNEEWKRSNEALGRSGVTTAEQLKESYKSLSAEAKKALSEISTAEREAQSQVEKVRKDRIEIESRYAEAIAQLEGGAGGASYGNAQALKIGAREALRAGDLEGAKQQAQAALKMLLDLQAAGENTYGLTGFAKELQSIEMQANSIEQTAADQKLAQITAELERVQKLSDVKITVGMTPEAIEAAKQQLQQLAEYLGKQMVITPTIAAPDGAIGSKDAEGYVLVGNNPPEPAGFATGGLIRGPGTGTSDSIPALLSNGEYVIRAAAVRKLGKNALDLLNRGIPIPRFADGGLVGTVASLDTGPRSLGSLDFNIGGDTFQLFADAGQADRIRTAAKKFGRTHR
ncbi:MAG: hypothetical protein OZ926_14800 [Pseudomonas sp.]|nr:hypothetical protein [Pseudomonas sp.]